MDSKLADLPVVKFWSLKSGRLRFALLLSFVYLSLSFVTVSLSMAMVCMVNTTSSTDNSGQNSDQGLTTDDQNRSTQYCPAAQDIKQEYKGTYHWGTYEQGFMFSAAYVGGFLVSLPAAWIVTKYNPKHTVSVSLFSTSLIGCMFPIVAEYLGYIGLTVVRFFIGFFGFSLCVPAIGAMFARWYPPAERSTAIAIYSSGVQLAYVIAMPINANLCRASFLGGWPLIFYISGAFGMFSTLIWIIFGSSSAENNKFVSKNEKLYITKSLINQSLGSAKDAVKREIPWLKILTSPIILTINFCYISLALFNVTLGTSMPTYFKEALSLSLQNNGFFSALPYILQFVSKLGFSISADLIKQKTSINHTVLCKIFTTIGFLGTSVFLLACSFMDCKTAVWAVVFLSLASFMSAASIPGFQTASYCVAPAYIGVLVALAGFPWNISAIFTPLLVAALTKQSTVSDWQHVFVLVVVFLLAACALFMVFGTVKIQSWAKLPPKNVDELKETKKISLSNLEFVKRNSNVEDPSVVYYRSNSKIENQHEKF